MGDILDFILWSAFAFHINDSLRLKRFFLHSLDSSLSLSLCVQFFITTQASTATHTSEQTNKQKKLTNPQRALATFIFILTYVCIKWRLLIRYCTVSILESWIKMIWNFDLQESRMTTFSLVVLPIVMKKYSMPSTCAQCALFENWLSTNLSRTRINRNTQDKDNRRKKYKKKYSMLSKSVGGCFISYFLHSMEIFHLDGIWFA